jgi:hypothetical protein
MASRAGKQLKQRGAAGEILLLCLLHRLALMSKRKALT